MRATFRVVALVVAGLGFSAAHAGLFDDEEARKAILDLRQRIDAVRTDLVRTTEDGRKSAEDAAQSRRSMLELQNQIQTLRDELASLRGQNEQLARDVSDLQRRQKDADKTVEDRLRKLEPLKVTVDGREFSADPVEKSAFEEALAIFRKADFPASQVVFVDFLRRYPLSGYAPSALFWLGNAQYATRNYKEAIHNFREVIALAPDHLRSPEAALAIANCQIELKDEKAARKTLTDLLKAYPQTEAGQTAKERLNRLK